MSGATKVAVCRAAGLAHWVLAVTLDDGRELLDLDHQASTWQALVATAPHAYPGVPCKVEADPYWTKRRRKVLFDENCRSHFADTRS